MEKIRKNVLNGAVLICAVTIGLRAILEMIYFDYPRQPDPTTGRTVPHVVKNVTIYITDNLGDVLYWLQWSFYFFGAVAVVNVILDLMWRAKLNRSD